ncbi:MAG: hypothetical protein IKU53_04770 [Firmicutes bacterium]|nr:hypothetical protein [Bacillota bacterium]
MVFEVDRQIFEHFPGLRIVTVLVENLPDVADEEGITLFLNDAWKIASAAAMEHGNPQSHPFIKAWGERMKDVGAPRKKFPCSIEAMVRRAGKSDEPFRINPIVDFYNAISLKNIVPAGGYDVDEVKDVIRLRLSKDGDTFCALDESEPEAISAGEVSYVDGNVVITRHFVWKQSQHCLLQEETKRILFVSEILGDLPADTAIKVASDFEDGLKKFFGVECKAVILDEENRTV